MTKQNNGIYIHKNYIIRRSIDFLNPDPPCIDVKYYTKSKRGLGGLRSITLDGMRSLIDKEVENYNLPEECIIN